RGPHGRLPRRVAGSRPVADVRQFDLPGPPFPAPADAAARALLPLPQPRREHAQGAGATLGAAGAGRGEESGQPPRPERRARLHRRAAPLPPLHGRAGGQRLRRAAMTSAPGQMATAEADAIAGNATDWADLQRAVALLEAPTLTARMANLVGTPLEFAVR